MIIFFAMSFSPMLNELYLVYQSIFHHLPTANVLRIRGTLKQFNHSEKMSTDGAALRYLSCLNPDNVILSFAPAGQQYTHLQ